MGSAEYIIHHDSFRIIADPGDGVKYGGSVEINLAANELQCDCTLVNNVALLARIAEGDGSWLNPSNVADWHQLACSRPDEVPVTVAEFIDGSNCTSAAKPTGSTKSNHATHDGLDVIPRRHRLVDQRRRKLGWQKQYAATGNAEVDRAQSPVKYVPSDMRLSRRLSTSGGSAALTALALCTAMLALLGGLLLCRAGVRRSRSGGGGRIRQCRQKRDLFVVYADEDEAWVTGTLLDVIFTRHPCYDVILQQHLQHGCDTHVTEQKWNNYEQMVFGSVIDHSTV